MTSHEPFNPYTWEELTRLWEREEITEEQMIGQLLVWMHDLYEMLNHGQRTQEILAHALTKLEARLEKVEEQQ